VGISSKTDTAKQTFTQLKDYTETHTLADTALFHLDRTTPFSYHNALNYKVIVNWEIAEHKSQGTMQLYMNQGDFEDYWYFSLNDKAGLQKCKDLFERLKKVPYVTPQY
jgi:hypothetical protein